MAVGVPSGWHRQSHRRQCRRHSAYSPSTTTSQHSLRQWFSGGGITVCGRRLVLGGGSLFYRKRGTVRAANELHQPFMLHLSSHCSVNEALRWGEG